MLENGDGVSPECKVLGLPVLPRLVLVQDTLGHPTHVGDLVRRGKIEIEGDALQMSNRLIWRLGKVVKKFFSNGTKFSSSSKKSVELLELSSLSSIPLL